VIALDTNLLVYALFSGYPEHTIAKHAIERACASAGGVIIAGPCVAEFWSIVTRPLPGLIAARPKAAEAFLRRLSEAGCQFIYPRRDFARRLAEEAVRHTVTGSRIFDLQIGLVSVEAGADELWTHDAGFTAPPGLRVLDPLQS
jgi:predicted nucleic acid-binding protein